MTLEQKKLLYEIAKLHITNFYNSMEDCWTDENFKISYDCETAINRLEKEYKEKYGSLPDWKRIDDVWSTITTLEDEFEHMLI